MLLHRGPDDRGDWVDAEAGIALGHRRLSVLDLSPAGHQPMVSSSGRYVIAFNGEVYNHREIRKELGDSMLPQNWRGHSDTETLLCGIDRWGLEASLKKTVGMFALALWDRQERKLTLARDRFGEKPLYYGWQGKTFLFGSELKALRQHPVFAAAIDRQALASYLCHGYIAGPASIYENIFKLLPGTYLQIPGDGRSHPGPQAYWSLREAVNVGVKRPYGGSEEEGVHELERLLSQAVSLQSIADVPLGAFLSGGVDSSTIVALMQAQSSRRVNTFTIGFDESCYNEAQQAKAVAQHLGTNHTELYVSPKDAMSVIPRLPVLYDEPFGDSSAIPTFLVSKLAREHVIVSLSGDGGDELFGGYTRYNRTHAIWSGMRRIPHLPRRIISKGLSIFAARGHSFSIARKASRVAHYLSTESAAACYEAYMAQRHDAADVVVGGSAPTALCASLPLAISDGLLYETMMYADGTTYLPDDILTKVDRAAMAVSLETRVPMLDHRIVEFAWCLPLQMKVRNGEGKWVLKQVLRKYVPPSLTDRPKMGFGVPVGEWLRGPLREWAENLLSEKCLKEDGFLNPLPIREQWLQHLHGDAPEETDTLWTVLMFQAWLSSAARS